MPYSINRRSNHGISHFLSSFIEHAKLKTTLEKHMVRACLVLLSMLAIMGHLGISDNCLSGQLSFSHFISSRCAGIFRSKSPGGQCLASPTRPCTASRARRSSNALACTLPGLHAGSCIGPGSSSLDPAMGKTSLDVFLHSGTFWTLLHVALPCGPASILLLESMYWLPSRRI